MNKKIIYIAGYGRSGSTLLDTVLGNFKGVGSLGEISNLFDVVRANENCSCGNPIGLCSHWKDVVKVIDDVSPGFDLSYCHRKVEAINLMSSKVDKANYFSFWSEIYNAKFESDNTLVDSSKVSRSTFFRPYNLKKMGYEVTFVHLYKKPSSLVDSLLKGSNKSLEVGRKMGIIEHHIFMHRSFLGALLANVSSLIIGQYISSRYIKINYLDIVSSPDKVCEEIFGHSLDEHPDYTNLSSGHGISGNRMRRGGEKIKILPKDTKHEIGNKYYNFLFSIMDKILR